MGMQHMQSSHGSIEWDSYPYLQTEAEGTKTQKGPCEQ